MNKKQLCLILGSIFVALGTTSCNSNAHNGNNSNSLSNLVGKFGQAQNATAQEWSYTYNSQKLLETAKDPNGNVTRYDYDGEGHLIKITNPFQQTISFSDFETHGNPQTVIDQNGVTTKLTYTVDGWLHSITIDGASSNFGYDDVGNLTSLILPDNTSFKYVYDDANYLMEIQGADGTIKYTRDNAGNITKTEISGADVTYADQRTYDEINRLLKITTAISTQSFSYDNDSNLQTMTDGRSNKTSYAYDALQRITQITNGKNGTVKYAYNNLKNTEYPETITDSKNNATIYQYNGLSNLLGLVSPDSGTHDYSAYDGNGNLLEQTDARGQNISYSYDALNRPTTIAYASDSSLNTIFTYDSGKYAIGKLSMLKNGISTTNYSYDVRGNTTDEIQQIDGSDYNLKYGYNKANQLTELTYPDGTKVGYSYSNGRVNQVTINGKEFAKIEHIPFGGISQLNYANGVTETIEYNSDYSIKALRLSNNMLTREYSYYGDGNIKSISGVNNYNYDQLGALANSESISYTYDMNQNRSSETINGKKTTYELATKSNKLVSKTLDAITSEYKYDDAGNMVTAGSQQYNYDALNRLSKVLDDGSAIEAYKYNALGQRIMKIDNRYVFSERKTIFIYNSQGQLLEEIDKYKNVSKDYVYADGQLIGIVTDGKFYAIISDHLNAPQLVLDSSGNNVWSATYTPFGKATTTGSFELNLRADGQYADKLTGLHYNWYRYYNPDLGRYITSDPLGLQAGMNTYIYVNGNPINYTDPMGLLGIGGLYDVTVEGGLHTIGAGSNTSGGSGVFINKNGVNIGAYTSNGTVIRMPSGIGAQYPSMKGSPELKPINRIYGAYAGRGYGGYITNANCAADLGGAGNAYSLNLPFISISLGISGDIWMGAFTLGPSVGLSFSSYPTNTNAAEITNSAEVIKKYSDIKNWFNK